jgi:DnaJ-class molecular chaperone
VTRAKIREKFNPHKYGMVFCMDCNGSGKSFTDPEENNVCKVCGGFGLIKKQEKASILDKRVPKGRGTYKQDSRFV